MGRARSGRVLDGGVTRHKVALTLTITRWGGTAEPQWKETQRREENKTLRAGGRFVELRRRRREWGILSYTETFFPSSSSSSWEGAAVVLQTWRDMKVHLQLLPLRVQTQRRTLFWGFKEVTWWAARLLSGHELLWKGLPADSEKLPLLLSDLSQILHFLAPPSDFQETAVKWLTLAKTANVWG